MKRLLAIILTLTLCISMSLAIASCDVVNGPENDKDESEETGDNSSTEKPDENGGNSGTNIPDSGNGDTQKPDETKGITPMIVTAITQRVILLLTQLRILPAKVSNTD